VKVWFKLELKKLGNLPAGCCGAVVIIIACRAGALGSITLGVTSLKVIFTVFYFIKIFFVSLTARHGVIGKTCPAAGHVATAIFIP